MPEYAYPGDSPPEALVVALHVVLVCVSLIPFVGLFLQSRRRAKADDLLLWIGVLILAQIVFGVAKDNLSEHSRPFVIGLLLLTEIVSLLAIIITGVRLYKQSNAINGFMVFGGLLGLILLVALLLPHVPSAGQAAFRSQCLNNLRQIGFGLHHYYAAAEAFPPPASVSEEGVAISWRIILAPYTELGDVSSRYDRSETWDSAANLPVAQDAPYQFICPANENQKDEQNRYYSAYAIPIGPETVFSDSNRQSIRQFSSEQSSTVAIVEACGRNIVWTRPEDVDMQTLPAGINLPGFKPSMSHGLISSTHPDGANVMRLDGSVQFLNQTIDEKTLRDLLITRD